MKHERLWTDLLNEVYNDNGGNISACKRSLESEERLVEVLNKSFSNDQFKPFSDEYFEKKRKLFNLIEKGNEQMKREQVLEKAKESVCGHRVEDYGKPENNFATIARFWEAYLQSAKENGAITISAKDVAIMMALLKVARASSGNNQDNYVDLAGYAACAAEIEESMRGN